MLAVDGPLREQAEANRIVQQIVDRKLRRGSTLNIIMSKTTLENICKPEVEMSPFGD